MLEMVQPFADFDWILADRFLKDEAYAEFYRQSTNLKVVDNSVTELGEPMSPEDLLKVVEDAKAQVVVSPDWLNDAKKTVQAYESFKKECESLPVEVAGVLQGSTPEEALGCLMYYDKGTVLVPYRVGGSEKKDADWIKALRRQLVVTHIQHDWRVHLLGFTTLSEFQWYARMPHVVSIDTDVPIRAGLLQVDFDDFDRTKDTSKIALTKDNWAAVCRNIALMRKYTNA
jgi:hypothetical protein